MPITITTLNNDSAVAKTFTLLGRDRSQTDWLNTTDSDDDFTSQLLVKQQIIGKTSKGSPIRRVLVQAKAVTLDQPNSTSEGPPSEEVTVNLTITAPTVSGLLTAAQKRDAVAFIRNLVTSGVVDQLIRGEV
jgi:hypothetical protein